jgi:pyrroloquinoline-quinone synthase
MSTLIDTSTVGADVEQVIAACQAIVERRRYIRHPFVTELDRLQPDRLALGRWAGQKYHQVFLQNSIFSAIHSNAAEYEDVRQYAMDQLIAEETGIASGSAPHYVLMRHFGHACGLPESAFLPDAAASEVREYVGTLRSLCGRHFVLGLLTVFSIESQSGESVAKVREWLRANHDFDEEDLEWFTVHAEEEDDHAATGLALVRRHGHECPDLTTAGPECVEEITQAWLKLQDYYLSLLQLA